MNIYSGSPGQVGVGGQGAVSPPPPKVLLMYPFFRRALELPFLKEVTKNVLEN